MFAMRLLANNACLSHAKKLAWLFALLLPVSTLAYQAHSNPCEALQDVRKFQGVINNYWNEKARDVKSDDGGLNKGAAAREALAFASDGFLVGLNQECIASSDVESLKISLSILNDLVYVVANAGLVPQDERPVFELMDRVITELESRGALENGKRREWVQRYIQAADWGQLNRIANDSQDEDEELRLIKRYFSFNAPTRSAKIYWVFGDLDKKPVAKEFIYNNQIRLLVVANSECRYAQSFASMIKSDPKLAMWMRIHSVWISPPLAAQGQLLSTLRWNEMYPDTRLNLVDRTNNWPDDIAFRLSPSLHVLVNGRIKRVDPNRGSAAEFYAWLRDAGLDGGSIN